MSLSEPLDKLIGQGKFYINKSHSFEVPDEFHGKLMNSIINWIYSLIICYFHRNLR